MKAILLIIGDEILNGTTLDTNSQYLARNLESLNIRIVRRLTIRDEASYIIEALDECLAQADLVITTGGLGPTKDDITKKTIAQYFNCDLVMNQEVLERVEGYFKRKNRPILESNRMQALVPEKAEVLANKLGTAPGMWIEENGKIVVSMPGVPYEMRYITDHGLLPRLEAKRGQEHILNRYLHTVGVGESRIAQILENEENALPENIRMAYLPSPGIVKIRLTGVGMDRDVLANSMQYHHHQMRDKLGDMVYSEDDPSISATLGKLLLDKGATLGTVESCSSGYLAQLITQNPGSSAYYEGSMVTYSYRLKELLLGVKHSTLTEHGAVSEETIVEMVNGGMEKLGCDYALATSGIAGPGGGMPNKPVGTVWIAVASHERTVAKRWQFGSDRNRNIHLTAVMALDMLRRLLCDLPITHAKEYTSAL